MMTSTPFKRRVKHFNVKTIADTSLNTHFFSTLVNEGVKTPHKTTEETITIAKPSFKPAPFDINAIDTQLHQLSFDISKQEVYVLFSSITEFMRDPILLAECLKDLDSSISKEFTEMGIALDMEWLNNLDLIAGKGCFLPDLPANYQPLTKGRKLDAILNAAETKYGVNKEGSAQFLGPVPKDVANDFIAKGNVFGEVTDITGVNLHGGIVHRLAIFAIERAMKLGIIKTNLPINQLLELMVRVKPLLNTTGSSDFTMWDLTIDIITDSIQGIDINSEALYDPKRYTFSCRSPFVFNSTLLCFGAKLGLPNLQFYLLDHFYKHLFRRMDAARNACDVDAPFTHKVSDEELYMHCLNMEIGATRIGAINKLMFFTQSQKKALANAEYMKKYKLLPDKKDPDAGNHNSEMTHLPIATKANPAHPIGYFKSWADYKNRKNFQQIKEAEKPVVFTYSKGQ